jgi:hypothetical protein
VRRAAIVAAHALTVESPETAITPGLITVLTGVWEGATSTVVRISGSSGLAMGRV